MRIGITAWHISKRKSLHRTVKDRQDRQVSDRCSNKCRTETDCTQEVGRDGPTPVFYHSQSEHLNFYLQIAISRLRFCDDSGV